MKKINSIDYGGKVITLGILFAVIIPAILFLFNKILQVNVINIIITTSIIIGAIILIGFFIFLSIELCQDKYLNNYYEKQKNIKVPLKNGLYECSACGNRTVRESDKSCSICGIKFKNNITND